jgi:hypothetical protein
MDPARHPGPKTLEVKKGERFSGISRNHFGARRFVSFPVSAEHKRIEYRVRGGDVFKKVFFRCCQARKIWYNPEVFFICDENPDL